MELKAEGAGERERVGVTGVGSDAVEGAGWATGEDDLTTGEADLIAGDADRTAGEAERKAGDADLSAAAREWAGPNEVTEDEAGAGEAGRGVIVARVGT